MAVRQRHEYDELVLQVLVGAAAVRELAVELRRDSLGHLLGARVSLAQRARSKYATSVGCCE